jgi:hypothetical protein
LGIDADLLSSDAPAGGRQTGFEGELSVSTESVRLGCLKLVLIGFVLRGPEAHSFS